MTNDPFAEEEVIRRLTEHCANHRKTGRAQFTTEGIEVLLAALANTKAEVASLREQLAETKIIQPTGHEED